MARPAKITPEETREAAELMRSGKSRASVARRYGMTGNGLQKALNRLAESDRQLAGSSLCQPAPKLKVTVRVEVDGRARSVTVEV